MKLVFITRKIDRNDPLTGFIFSWLEKLARGLDRLVVICQEKGDTTGLASNIDVHSFGKEKGYGKLRQFFSLFALSFSLGSKADGFFVHMHPIYAIVAWFPAKLFGKKLVLWYTHKSVDLKLRIAHTLVTRVLTASKESFRLPSNKVKIVGHGIDINKFKVKSEKLKINVQNGQFQIIAVGRISPVKDYETLLAAARILKEREGLDFELKIYGKIGLKEQAAYLQSLRDFARQNDLSKVVEFAGDLPYDKLVQVYAQADMLVSASQTGSVDKNVLEAAASKILVLSSNEAFLKPLSRISPFLVFQSKNSEDLADKMLKLMNLSIAEKERIKEKLREWVAEAHNLDNLAGKILEEFKR